MQRQRAQAAAKGDIDAFLASAAENAVVTAGRYGFRVEGKEALKTHYTALWQQYPTRQSRARQTAYRVYNNGTVVVSNSYNEQTFVDRSGQISPAMMRVSQTWVKTDGRWLLVDLHVSKITGIQ